MRKQIYSGMCRLRRLAATNRFSSSLPLKVKHTTMTTTTAAADIFAPWINTLQELDPKAFLTSFFSKSSRPDGRLFSMCRTTTVTTGVLQKNTVGSSLVRFGNTKVLCGITVQIGVPSTVPNQGDVIVVPPDEAVQSILTQMLDLSCLGILDGQAAWRLVVTWHILQDDGNVWDAVLVAAVAALMDTRLPATQHNANKGTMELIDISDEVAGTPLVVQFLPVPLTVGIYNSPEGVIHLLADPTQDEVPLLEGYLTMVVSDDDQIVHTKHASKLGLKRDDLTVCAHMAYGRGKEIRTLLSP